jgi:hypothetical protein
VDGIARGIVTGYRPPPADAVDVAWDGGINSAFQPSGLLSLDLSDPAGMDLAARWLARHHGEKVAITAPAWTYVAAVAGREHRTADGTYIDHDEARPATWLLICDEGTVAFAQWDPDDGPTPTEGGDGVDVWLTDWSDDPAEALIAACLAAGGRS